MPKRRSVKRKRGPGFGGGAIPLVSSTPCPPVPTNVTVDSFDDSSIQLSWDATPGASMYSLHRGPSGGPWDPVGRTFAAPEFDDVELSPGTEYCYRVAAGNDSCFSEYSSEVCQITDAPAYTGLVVGMAAGTGTTITFPDGTTDGDVLMIGINSAANDGDVVGSTDPFGFNNGAVRGRRLIVSGGATTAAITGTGPFVWVCTAFRGSTVTLTDVGIPGFGSWATTSNTLNLYSNSYAPALTNDHQYIMLGGIVAAPEGLDLIENWTHPRLAYQQPVAVASGSRWMAMAVSEPLTGTINLGGGVLNVAGIGAATAGGRGWFGLLL